MFLSKDSYVDTYTMMFTVFQLRNVYVLSCKLFLIAFLLNLNVYRAKTIARYKDMVTETIV